MIKPSVCDSFENITWTINAQITLVWMTGAIRFKYENLLTDGAKKNNHTSQRSDTKKITIFRCTN